MQSDFYCTGNQTSALRATDRTSGWRRKAPPAHAHSQHNTRQQASPFPLIFSGCICCPPLSKAMHCAIENKALRRRSNPWRSPVLSASVLSSTCFCRDPFAGFCFLDGGYQCFRGMKARFSCVQERRMCWQLHFPRKRCTVQLLLYKIKQF